MVDSQLLIYPRPERLGGGGVARVDIGFAMDGMRVINTVLYCPSRPANLLPGCTLLPMLECEGLERSILLLLPCLYNRCAA